MEHSIGTPLFWILFIVVVLFLLAIDLGVFHRRAHAVSVREALAWSVVWILLSISFGIWIYKTFGRQYGLEFFAGYLIEYALSVDNVFVFILIFSYFAVPSAFHHRVLFWGILSALVMRASFIIAGAALIQTFSWVLYIFGAFLIVTGIKIIRQGDTKIEPERNPVVRLFRRWMPITAGYGSGNFFVRNQGRLMATPLALVLVTVEATDVVFATDSIPAIFGVTRDPFIVYTSNICAILGLRSMYFLLSAIVNRFAYLGTGLGIVLIFIGVKMLTGSVYHIPIGISLSVVALILSGSILLSLLHPPKKSRER
ncbi:MAG: TerC family protein [Acidobacteria bacterium]|nr:TerC family protein [Acidobacteriota bacterium]